VISHREERSGYVCCRKTAEGVLTARLRFPEKPEDIANMYVFLASEYADYLTGDALNVAGGLVMA